MRGEPDYRGISPPFCAERRKGIEPSVAGHSSLRRRLDGERTEKRPRGAREPFRRGSSGSFASRAPLRIDLAGGTLDIWPLYLLLDGAVTVNLAIDRYASVEVQESQGGFPKAKLVQAICRHLFPGGAAARFQVDCKRGSGLGGSSSLAVALLHALTRLAGKRPDKAKLLALARDLEARVISTPTGIQDYIAALHGGLSVIRFRPGGFDLDRLADREEEVASRIVLIESGVTHFSGLNNWSVFRAAFEQDRSVRRRLQSIATIALDVAQAIGEGALDACGKLIAKEWGFRKKLAPGITTPEIDQALRIGKRHGAISGKACGAGGGGSVFLFCRDGASQQVAKALALAGYVILPAKAARRGVRSIR